MHAYQFFLLQGCNAVYSTADHSPEWATPTALHSLVPTQVESTQIIWNQHFYAPGGVDKRVKCTSVEGVVVLVGSLDAQTDIKILALDGETGSFLWSFDNPRILANSDSELFIANGTKINSIDPITGIVKWEKQLPGSRNITGMMYDDGFLYVNTTGIYTYYVIGTDGEIVSKYIDVSDFRSSHSDIPFYPDLPFGTVIGDDVFIVQRGDALYSSEVYDKPSKELLWEVKRDSISNFINHYNSVLWISSDDQVKITDRRSGNLLESIGIVPSIDFFAPNIDKQHAGYYLCGDKKSNNVYVILGDSQQIFAIRFK